MKSNGKSTKQSSPTVGQKMTKVPKYFRLAYKIFFKVRRSEIINARIQAYDLSLKISQDNETVECSINFPQLTLEVNQIWEDLSSNERNEYKLRAMIQIKRQRVVAKNEELSSLEPSKGMMIHVSKDNDPTSVHVNEGIGEDVFLNRSMASTPSNLSMMTDPTQMKQDAHVSHQDFNLQSSSAKTEEHVELTVTNCLSSSRHSSHGYLNYDSAADAQITTVCATSSLYPQSNLTSMYHDASQASITFVPVSFGSNNSQYQTNNMYASAMRYGSPISHHLPYGYQCISYPVYSQQYGAMPLMVHPGNDGDYHRSSNRHYLQQYGGTEYMVHSPCPASDNKYCQVSRGNVVVTTNKP